MAATTARDDKDKPAADQPSAEVLARRAMGKSDTPAETGHDSSDKTTVTAGVESGESSPGNAFVPAPGGDPDSVQRAIKHLPDGVRELVNAGADNPDELAAQRAEYGAAAEAGGYHGGRLPKDMSDEEKANITGQPIGDGKSTGAVSTSAATEAEIAALRRVAATAGTDGESRVQGRRATPPSRQTTAKDNEEK